MAVISNVATLLQFQSISFEPAKSKTNHRISAIGDKFRFGSNYISWNPRKVEQKFPVKVICSLEDSDEKRIRNDKEVRDSGNQISKFREMISSNVTPVVFEIKRQIRTNHVAIWCVVISFSLIAVRDYINRKSRNSHHGSVADLVKRGQLRSDRRGISGPLKYDDPFDNPLVKVNETNSTVEMCGKVYRLAPITLTQDEQSSHQRRRSRAYQWKRPTMFIKEGDSIPPDVDPDTVRWIPANHPFATTVNEIDEDLAQNNMYQKTGVPYRIKAEHEALQKKLESLQNEQKLNKMVIDPSDARDFERPFKSAPVDRKSNGSQAGNSSSVSPNSHGNDTSSEEMKKL
ncbi:protein MULTIPLE CHLOROPLAST DIVISION SITE 1-like [Papaver somniferum]|uniref:protein MULTIPLE CHLOROPLAST DIVISION SITE 1-like n=1 Tax=Papaver somniferum TaxID=3469 RepID=UPI000E702237|nr:protein MULTIPLE CHLOROPLAST DIVISION SITE 1-like [Papaver somniferum]